MSTNRYLVSSFRSLSWYFIGLISLSYTWLHAFLPSCEPTRIIGGESIHTAAGPFVVKHSDAPFHRTNCNQGTLYPATERISPLLIDIIFERDECCDVVNIVWDICFISLIISGMLNSFFLFYTNFFLIFKRRNKWLVITNAQKFLMIDQFRSWLWLLWDKDIFEQIILLEFKRASSDTLNNLNCTRISQHRYDIDLIDLCKVR